MSAKSYYRRYSMGAQNFPLERAPAHPNTVLPEQSVGSLPELGRKHRPVVGLELLQGDRPLAGILVSWTRAAGKLSPCCSGRLGRLARGSTGASARANNRCCRQLVRRCSNLPDREPCKLRQLSAVALRQQAGLAVGLPASQRTVGRRCIRRKSPEPSWPTLRGACDANGAIWLRLLLPCDYRSIRVLRNHSQKSNWHIVSACYKYWPSITVLTTVVGRPRVSVHRFDIFQFRWRNVDFRRSTF